MRLKFSRGMRELNGAQRDAERDRTRSVADEAERDAVEEQRGLQGCGIADGEQGAPVGVVQAAVFALVDEGAVEPAERREADCLRKKSEPLPGKDFRQKDCEGEADAHGDLFGEP